MDDLLNLVFGTFGSRSHLVVRLGLGVVFFAHGAQKVFRWFPRPPTVSEPLNQSRCRGAWGALGAPHDISPPRGRSAGPATRDRRPR